MILSLELCMSACVPLPSVATSLPLGFLEFSFLEIGASYSNYLVLSGYYAEAAGGFGSGSISLSGRVYLPSSRLSPSAEDILLLAECWLFIIL